MTALNWEGSQREGFGVCSEDKLQSMGSHRVRHDSVTKHAHTRSKGQLS